MLDRRPALTACRLAAAAAPVLLAVTLLVWHELDRAPVPAERVGAPAAPPVALPVRPRWRPAPPRATLGDDTRLRFRLGRGPTAPLIGAHPLRGELESDPDGLPARLDVTFATEGLPEIHLSAQRSASRVSRTPGVMDVTFRGTVMLGGRSHAVALLMHVVHWRPGRVHMIGRGPLDLTSDERPAAWPEREGPVTAVWDLVFEPGPG